MSEIRKARLVAVDAGKVGKSAGQLQSVDLAIWALVEPGKPALRRSEDKATQVTISERTVRR